MEEYQLLRTFYNLKAVKIQTQIVDKQYNYYLSNNQIKFFSYIIDRFYEVHIEEGIDIIDKLLSIKFVAKYKDLKETVRTYDIFDMIPCLYGKTNIKEFLNRIFEVCLPLKESHLLGVVLMRLNYPIQYIDKVPSDMLKDVYDAMCETYQKDPTKGRASIEYVETKLNN